jgi:vitamin B12 transporter
MSSIVKACARRSFWLASTVLIPLSPFVTPSAHAQQSASPDLLPPVEVSPPKRAETAQPPAGQKPKPRQAATRPNQQKPPEKPATPQQGIPNTAPTVVSPTGIVTPASQVASSFTAITAQDIATQQYRTLPDALNTVPGLNVVQTGGPGGQTSVFMRGTNSNHTKVIVDGIDIGDPTSPNGAFDFAHLLTSDIQQVEVLRGPQSGLYGSDAIGGVISIITQKGEGPARWTASNEAGSFGTFNQSIGVSGSQDNYNYAASISHVHASDVPVTPLQLLPPGQQAIGNNYDNMTYSTKTGINLSDSLALNSVLRYTEATLLFTGTNTPGPNFTVLPDAEQSRHTVHQFFGREEAVWSLFDGRIKNYFGVNYTSDWTSDNGPTDPVSTITTGNRLKYDWHSVTEVVTGQNLVVGLERENSELNTTGLSAQTGNSADFVEWQSKFANRFFLTANIREDDNDSFGQHMTYRIAPSVILPFTDTTIKASYGTGFKAPTLSQLFQSFPDFNFFANPNLKPEQSRGADIGFEQPLFNDRIRFGSTYFKNNITDLIDFNSTFTSNINIDNAITEGTESFITLNIIDRVKIRADYTVTRAVDAATGLELLRRPKEKFSITTIYNPIDPLTLSATVLRVSDWVDIDRAGDPGNVIAPGYTTVNLRADYAINDQLKVFGRIDNLANVHYQNPTGFLAPGLGVFGGIRFASYGVK